MKTILLTRNKKALVDDDVYEWLSDYNWYSRDAENPRAVREVLVGGKHTKIYLHKLICGYPPYFKVMFGNRDCLDCRKPNLKPINLSGYMEKWVSGVGSSEYLGPRWNRDRGIWDALFEGCLIAQYTNEIDAARAYNAKALEVFGENAQLNEIPFLPTRQANSYPTEEDWRSFKTSKFRGVYRDLNGMFISRTSAQYLGMFKKEKDAAEAHDVAVLHRGQTERMNLG
jgi:hypothetical protein